MPTHIVVICPNIRKEDWAWFALFCLWLFVWAHGFYSVFSQEDLRLAGFLGTLYLSAIIGSLLMFIYKIIKVNTEQRPDPSRRSRTRKKHAASDLAAAQPKNENNTGADVESRNSEHSGEEAQIHDTPDSVSELVIQVEEKQPELVFEVEEEQPDTKVALAVCPGTQVLENCNSTPL